MTDLKSCSNLDSEGRDEYFLKDLSRIPSDRVYSIYLSYPAVNVKLADGQVKTYREERIVTPAELSKVKTKCYKNCYDVHDLWYTIANMGSSRLIPYQDVMDGKVRIPILTTGSHFSVGMIRDIRDRLSKFYDPELIYCQLKTLTSIIKHKYILPHTAYDFNVFFASGSPLLNNEQLANLTNDIRMFQVINDVTLLVGGNTNVINMKVAGAFRHYGSKLNELNLDFLIMNVRRYLAEGWNSLSVNARQLLVTLGQEIKNGTFRTDIMAQVEGKLLMKEMTQSDIKVVHEILRPSILALISLTRLKEMLSNNTTMSAITPYFHDLIVDAKHVAEMRSKLVPELIERINGNLQTMKNNFKNYFVEV